MSITSWYFIAFVALTVILSYAVPVKYKWIVILAASVVFYVSFSPAGLAVLTVTALLTYAAALQIQKIHTKESAWMDENKKTADKETRKAKKAYFQKLRNRFVILVVVLCIGQLFLFKYYGYFAENINAAFSTHLWTAENLLLPLGISFYSLQLISYVVDVSRGITPAERNPFKVILFGAFFLSIMQGPFNRYNDLMPQICNQKREKLSFSRIRFSALKIAWGYMKKMCIADQIGQIATEVFSNYTQYTGFGILLGMFCFAVQLYADFSGYMDIVSGVGELLGIQLPLNFRQPFFSRNMSEFWQRWHISLGAWLKDYVFYPVLKSGAFQKMGKWLTKKVGKEAGRRIPTYLGMVILWTLIGAWHGAGFQYVFGVGLLQFLYIFTGEIFMPVTRKIKSFLRIKDENPLWHIFQSLRCTVLMIFAWVFFNSNSFADALGMLGRVFAEKTLYIGQIKPIFYSESTSVSGIFPTWMIYIFLCTVLLVVIDLIAAKGVSIREKIESRPYPVRAVVYLACFFAIFVFGAYGQQFSSTDFIYFGF